MSIRKRVRTTDDDFFVNLIKMEREAIEEIGDEELLEQHKKDFEWYYKRKDKQIRKKEKK